MTRLDVRYHMLAFAVTALFAAPPAFAATFVVTKTADTDDGVCDADCSLREAISAANAAAGDDDVTVPGGTYLLSIAGDGEDLNATGDLDITENLGIQGAGANATSIDGNLLDRVFHILAGTVSISDMTIQNGNNGASDNGGAIENAGASLTLSDVIVDSNVSSNAGGAISSAGSLALTNVTVSGSRSGGLGGGIYNDGGTVTITTSTVSGNRANSANGAGIANVAGGTLTADNSTISGNRVSGGGSAGGGLFNDASSASFTNVTFSNNRVSGSGSGGGIDNVGGGTVTANNTIVADNAPDNCFGGLTSGGHNLDDDGTCGFVGAGDQSNVADPRIGDLQDNGGPTQTHAVLAGSGAIDAGDTVCPAPDQRGEACADGDADAVVTRDIGAYERATFCPSSPAVGCITAGKGVLVAKEKVPGKELVRTVLRKLTTAVVQNQFGDPVAGTTKYNLCLYDDGDTLVTSLLVDRTGGALCGTRLKPCWKAISDKGYRFVDNLTASDGMRRLVGKGNDAGKGKVVVKAKNNVNKGQLSLPTGIVGALQGSTFVTVQVHTSDADCFSMVTSEVKRDDGLVYKAIVP